MGVYTLHSLQKRTKTIIFVLLILFVCLGVRLFIVQILKGEELQQRAVDQWTRDLSLTAERGSFFDATGDSLAVSYTTYDVYVRGREVEDAEKTAKVLSELLELNFDKTLQKVSKKNVSEVLLKLQIESDLAEKLYKEKLSGIFGKGKDWGFMNLYRFDFFIDSKGKTVKLFFIILNNSDESITLEFLSNNS